MQFCVILCDERVERMRLWVDGELRSRMADSWQGSQYRVPVNTIMFCILNMPVTLTVLACYILHLQRHTPTAMPLISAHI